MILVDFGHLSKRGIFAAKPDIIANPKYAAHVVSTMILNVVERFGASKHNPVVIAVDSKPSWRHHFYDEHCRKFPEYRTPEDENEFEKYKGRRPKDEELPWDEIQTALNDLLAALKNFSDFIVLEIPLCEADDIIAVLAKMCVARKEDCFLISSDKDFKQLQDGEYVQIYDPMKQAFVPDIDVVQFKRFHILIGDKTDNIKACRPRLGEKTAEKILPVIVETLKTNPAMRERYKFNQILIDLDKIPQDVTENIVEAIRDPQGCYNAMGMMKFFQTYRLSAIAERTQLFKLPANPKQTKLNSLKERERQLLRAQEESLDSFFTD